MLLPKPLPSQTLFYRSSCCWGMLFLGMLLSHWTILPVLSKTCHVFLLAHRDVTSVRVGGLTVLL
jgi:hypothetical protein